MYKIEILNNNFNPYIILKEKNSSGKCETNKLWQQKILFFIPVYFIKFLNYLFVFNKPINLLVLSSDELSILVISIILSKVKYTNFEQKCKIKSLISCVAPLENYKMGNEDLRGIKDFTVLILLRFIV